MQVFSGSFHLGDGIKVIPLHCRSNSEPARNISRCCQVGSFFVFFVYLKKAEDREAAEGEILEEHFASLASSRDNLPSSSQSLAGERRALQGSPRVAC